MVLTIKQETKYSKLFDKWGYEDIQVKDSGLERYISLKPVAIPHSMGRHEHKRFRKATVNLVERLINNLMRPGKNSGKKSKAANIVKIAFDLINLHTNRNPLEVLVRAVEHAAPCEDTTRISYGGVVYHLSVDVSQQRRIDLAIRNLCTGARRASLNNPRPIEECLSEEILLASKNDINSHAISRRHELERVAQASR